MTDAPDDPRPPIDDLSDVAWARVERGMWSRLDNPAQRAPAPTPRRYALLGLAAAGVAAAAALVVVVVRHDGARDGAHDGAQPIAQVDEPSRVVSGAAPSTVSLGDAHVELAAGTAIVMTRPATVLLEHGAAWFSVAPRGDRPAFVVLAGDTTVRVIGTRFHVARDGERADVEVDHGTVQVEFRGTVARVAAGQHWSSETPAIVAAIAPVAPPPVVTPPPPVVTPDEPKPVAPPPKPRADVDRAEYDRLTALEVRDPIAAVAGYLALSQHGGAWAEVALFAAGRLAADHHDHRAATLLTVYLRRFPHGANRADAEQLLARLGDPR